MPEPAGSGSHQAGPFGLGGVLRWLLAQRRKSALRLQLARAGVQCAVVGGRLLRGLWGFISTFASKDRSVVL